MKSIIVSLVLLTAGLATSAQEKGIAFLENEPWQQILERSGKEDKLIFLDCYTTWCGPCKAMAREVFPQQEVGDFMNASFINVKQDMEKGEGVALNKQYKSFIPGYPTYLLINAKGAVVHQVSGYQEAQVFIRKMKDGLEMKSWIALSARYQDGERNWPFIRQYLTALESAFQRPQIDAVLKEVLPLMTYEMVVKDSIAYGLFKKYWTDVRSPMFNEVLAAQRAQRAFGDNPLEVGYWAGRLFRHEVSEVVKKSKSGAAMDTADVSQLIGLIERSEVFNRSNLLAMLRLSLVAAEGNRGEFLDLVHAGKQFGVLTDNLDISDWARRLAEGTRDKAELAAFLALTKDGLGGKMVAPGQVRNYAALLRLTGAGREADAAEAKAKQLEADILEKMKGSKN